PRASGPPIRKSYPSPLPFSLSILPARSLLSLTLLLSAVRCVHFPGAATTQLPARLSDPLFHWGSRVVLPAARTVPASCTPATAPGTTAATLLRSPFLLPPRMPPTAFLFLTPLPPPLRRA